MKSTLKNENTPGGRTFKVTITETYQRTVTIYESEMKEPTVEEAQRVQRLVAGQPDRAWDRGFPGRGIHWQGGR